MDKIVLTEEVYEKLNEMLEGICWKKDRYITSVGLTHEDVVQELWCKAMQVIDDCGGEANLSLIASCCYNLIVDLARKQFVRVNQIPMPVGEMLDTMDCSNDSRTQRDMGFYVEDCFWNKNLKLGTDFDSGYVIEEILGLFEEGSKELEYIKLVMIYSGVDTSVDPNLFFDFDASMRNELAWKLGYAGSGSNGFRGVERRVRSEIEKYLKDEVA